MYQPQAQLVEWPDATLVKVVESSHLPYIKTYRVAVDFSSLGEAQEFVNSVLYAKTSGDDLNAGAWTDHGDGINYPGKLVAIPSQEEADAAGAHYRLVGNSNTPVDSNEGVEHEPIHE
jgi:hypothetical protein